MIAALLLIAIALAAPLVSRRLTGDIGTPGAIMIGTWAGTLGLFALGLLDYPPLPAHVQLLIAGAVAAVVGGALVGHRLADRRHRRAADPADAIGDVRLRRPAATVAGLALVGLAGVAWYARLVVATGGWGLFARGEELRYLLTTYAIPSHYLFLQQVCGPAALVAWALVLSGTRIGVVGTLAALAAALGTLTSTDRTQIFTLLLSGGCMYALRRGATLPIGRLIAAGGAGALVLAVAFFTIGAWTGKSASHVGLRMRLPAAPPGTWPARVLDTAQQGSVAYFYATGSYPALALLVDAGHPRTNGRHTFFPVLRPLQRAGLVPIDLPPAIPPFVIVARRADGAPFGTNAYTFLYYPLEDFGPIGALAYAAVVGVGCGWVFAWARRDRGSALRLLVAGQMSMALALTFFVNKFNNTSFWYALLWTAGPFLWAEWRARRRALSAPRAPAPAPSPDATGRRRPSS
jgi:hypothetical protein